MIDAPTMGRPRKAAKPKPPKRKGDDLIRALDGLCVALFDAQVIDSIERPTIELTLAQGERFERWLNATTSDEFWASREWQRTIVGVEARRLIVVAGCRIVWSVRLAAQADGRMGPAPLPRRVVVSDDFKLCPQAKNPYTKPQEGDEA